MFLRHRDASLSTPRIKKFYYIPTNKCEKSSTHSELSVQSGRHLPCLWLVEFWCTRSRDSAPLIKSLNFYGTSQPEKINFNNYSKCNKTII